MQISKDEVRFFRPPQITGLELVAASYRRRAFPVHSHEEYVIGVITRGIEQLSIRGEQLTVRAGDFILIEPGEAHANQTVDNEGVAYRVFYIPAIILEKSYGHHRFPRNVVPGTGLAREWANLHRRWMDHDAVGDLERSFMEILGAILRAKGTLDEPFFTVAHHGITRARAYLDEHFAEPVSLEDLAKDSGLSRYHLLRSFREQVGITPGAYQIQLRVLEARRRLRTGANIADVAFELGFADQSHLSRHFQRVIGTSPGRYAQQ